MIPGWSSSPPGGNFTPHHQPIRISAATSSLFSDTGKQSAQVDFREESRHQKRHERRGGDEEEEPRAPIPGSEELHVIIAACSGRQGQLGLAYVDLDAQEKVLYVADVLDPSFSHLHTLKHSLLAGGGQHRQGLCVVPSRSPIELMECALEPLLDPSEASPFPVAVLKITDFDFDTSRQRLTRLRLGDTGQVGHSTADSKEPSRATLELRGHSILDLDNEQLVRAAGGLVRYMEKNRAHLGDLDDQSQSLRIHSFKLFTPSSLMSVDAQTMAALQVFKEERNPSLIRGSGRSKEGLSLYSLLEPFVASPAGRSTLRRWLRQPSRDLSLLLGRQDAVEELGRPQRREFLREIHRELREVRDLAALLRRVFGCYHFDNLSDWSSLVRTVEHMAGALALLRGESLDISLDAFSDTNTLVADVTATEDMLHSVLDLEASPGGRPEVHVRKGVDEKLDAVREQYESIDRYLTEVAQIERLRLSDLGHERSLCVSLLFHYFPQLGFHVSVPNPLSAGDDGDAEDMMMLKRDVEPPDEDWKYQFAGSGRLFYKCSLAMRLDAEIGDLVVAARELELELLLGVVDRLRRFETRLCRAAQVLADFDALIGLAVAANEFGWRRPLLVPGEPQRLNIVKGRHPIAQAALAVHNKFIPNDTVLGVPICARGTEERVGGPGSSVARVQVVTGANLAGKSVYLKQVGLVVLLAHVGSFVPAEKAELGLCDFLFSRIQNTEGANVRLSTFGMDVTQVSRALRHGTGASLLLLDEFGKGTNAADGVALLASTIEYLCRQPQAPKAIVTTHFLEIFKFGLVSCLEPGLSLSSMRVLPPEIYGGDATYLYQLVPGIAEGSFGLECAKRAGMDAEVIQRAAEILRALERGDTLRAAAPERGDAKDADGEDGTFLHSSRKKRRPDLGTTKTTEVCGEVVSMLRATDPNDLEEVWRLLRFVEAQQDLFRVAGA